jgi:acyl-coenzyme A thioesterase PaaI-like protein
MAATLLDGFAPHARKSPLTDPWEPLYARKLADRTVLGVVVATPHTNSRGFLHGGLIAALADNAMGLSCGVVLARDGLPAGGLVTVSLGVDYVGKAGIGQWLAFDTTYVRPGRTICFAEAQVTADGEPVARARATFRVLAAAATA